MTNIKLILMLFLSFAMTELKAQQVIAAAGGDTSGSGGSVAYSVGQIVYTLNVGKTELSNLNFQLYDMSGKVIESNKITSITETIRMENLPSSTYFLKVTNNNKEVKTFKIIKNEHSKN